MVIADWFTIAIIYLATWVVDFNKYCIAPKHWSGISQYDSLNGIENIPQYF